MFKKKKKKWELVVLTTAGAVTSIYDSEEEAEKKLKEIAKKIEDNKKIIKGAKGIAITKYINCVYIGEYEE